MVAFISLSDIAPLLNYKDCRAVEGWCQRHGLPIDSVGGKKCVAKLQFIKERCKNLISRLQEQHDEGWVDVFKAYMDDDLAKFLLLEDELRTAKSLVGNSQRISRQHTNLYLSTSPNQRASYDGSAMSKKPYYIPPNKRVTGLVVWCDDCGTNVYDVCKKTGNHLTKCPNPESHHYKEYVHVPGTNNERRTLTFHAASVDDAVKRAIEFREMVKSEGRTPSVVSHPVNEINQEKIEAPLRLEDAMALYLGFLKNENVPVHKREERSDEHIADVARAFRSVLQSLNTHGYESSKLRMDQVDDDVVGVIYSYWLEEKQYANSTFTRYIGHCWSLFNWYGKNYTPLKNFFDDVPRKKAVGNTDAITPDEYRDLVARITPENGIKKYPGGVKTERNLYRPWLKDGIRLGMETGRRREEITQMRFSDIVDDADGGYVKVEDRKVNHMQNRIEENEKIYVYVPLTASLRELLLEMGWDKYKGMSTYVLAPEETLDRRLMCDMLSRGFSHYYNQLNTGRTLTFKSLRKAYITALSLYMGGNAKAISGHSSDAVVDKHYRNKSTIAKAAGGFDPLTMTSRKNELERLRQDTDQKPTLTKDK